MAGKETGEREKGRGGRVRKGWRKEGPGNRMCGKLGLVRAGGEGGRRGDSLQHRMKGEETWPHPCFSGFGHPAPPAAVYHLLATGIFT